MGHIYTLFFVLMGWVLFAIEDMGQLGSYFSTMFGGAAFCDRSTMYLLTTSLPLLLAGFFASTQIASRLYQRINQRCKALPMALTDCAGVAAILLFSTAYLISSSYNPFLYFRF